MKAIDIAMMNDGSRLSHFPHDNLTNDATGLSQ